MCNRNNGSLRTLTTHVLVRHEYTVDGEPVPRHASSPAQSVVSKAPPMSTTSSVVDPREIIQADLAMSSSGSDAATASRPEIPAAFTVNSDSEMEKGEIREGTDASVEPEGEMETAAADPTPSSDWMSNIIATVAHPDGQTDVVAAEPQKSGPSSARTLPVIDLTRGRVPT